MSIIVEMKSLLEKAKTFPEARAEMLDGLAKKGWKVKGELKIPHATSPDGDVRLWFKTQAVYFSLGKGHDFKNARTLSYDLDIRKMSPEDLEKMAFKERDR
jgi:hypothetical protein